jgi:hypothetical protein
MRRVARRVVVFGADHEAFRQFWLTRDYLPELCDFIADRPSVVQLADAIGARVEPVWVPWDCVDGFYEAYWRRPEAYLDEMVRRGVSLWSKLGEGVEDRAVRELRADLDSGRWAERNGELLGREVADVGIRLLIA